MKINQYSSGSNSELLTEFAVVVELVNELMSSFHDVHLLLRWMYMKIYVNLFQNILYAVKQLFLEKFDISIYHLKLC